MSWRARSFLAALAFCLGPPTVLADSALKPADFRWTAPVQVPANASVARLAVPAEALAQLRSSQAADLRLFDGQGAVVPFALTPPPSPEPAAEALTATFQALPLQSARVPRPPPGAVQLRVQGTDRNTSVWVQLAPERTVPGGAAPRGAQRLPAALFDTRGQTQPLTALVLRGQWPANTAVAFSVSTSADLASWTPVTSQGRVFRFEGANAPANDTLRLNAPLALKDRYLRLDWSGDDSVTLTAVRGLVAPEVAPPPKPAVALGAARAAGPAAIEWELPFATPMVELALTATRPDTLVPLRVLGRRLPSEPWHHLGQGVLFRLGTAGTESMALPLALRTEPVRWLRVEATHGVALDPALVAARAVFAPVQLLFVAGARGPFVLAAGREHTVAAALPLATMAGSLSTPWPAWPEARTGPGTLQSPAAPADGWWPQRMEGRTAALWGVLLLGVLLLGGAAWSLLRSAGRRDGER